MARFHEDDARRRRRPRVAEIITALFVSLATFVVADGAAAGDVNRLAVETAGACLADDQIEVEVWMRDLAQPVTGFQAFLAFDHAVLTYRGDLSTYTGAPFPLHIQPLSTAEVEPGELRLDGSAALGDPGDDQDALLATLVFDVTGVCETTAIAFDVDELFASELSFEGLPVATVLNGSPPFTLDGTPPSIDCPDDLTVPADAASCCQGGDLVEAEMCGDADNDGCNLPGPAFAEGVLGETWCGTAWADDGSRDTDWRRVTVTSGPELSAVLWSEAPCVVFIIDGIDTCTPTVIGEIGWSTDCAPGIARAPVTPGEYVIFVAPGLPDGSGVFDGRPCADGQTQYRVQLGGAPPNAAPDNDDCVDASPIELGSTAYDTTLATTDGVAHGACSFDGQTYQDIWFTYTADAAGLLNVSTCGQALYDTDLAVYDGCGLCPPGDAELLNCSDDAPGCPDFTSEVTIAVLEGGCYTIRVGGWMDGDAGAGILTLELNGAADTEAPPSLAAEAIAVLPAAGAASSGCFGATVDFDPPVVMDGCDGDPEVVCVPPSGSFFPIGVSNVTCTAVDDCGNVGMCDFVVNVEAVNLASVVVELPGSLPTSRCIRFTPDDCGAVADVTLDFIDHDDDPATPVRAEALVPLPCGDWTTLCAKDEQHTISSTAALTVTPDGSIYEAGSTFTLLAGDTDNDDDIDISDVTWLLFTFGELDVDGGCPWNGLRDADFNNGGAVGSVDYSLLSANYLANGDCSCEALAGAAGARTDARTLPAAVRERADLNHDGWIDVHDVVLFEAVHGLPSQLSDAMRNRRR